MADRYGRRPVILVSLVLFCGASLVAAMADEIAVFLCARVVQGAIISGSALASAIISDTTEKAKAASLMGYLSMAMAVAPMLAPTLGGALDQWFGWRSGFWLYSVLGLAMLALCWRDLGGTNPAPADTFWDQLRAYPELFRSRRFWGYAICMAFSIGSFYIFISSAPLVGTQIYGLSPSVVGMGIGSITGGFFIGSFLSGLFAERKGIIWMVFVGRIVPLIGLTLAAIMMALGWTHPAVFFAGAISAGVGNGLGVPSARAGTVSIRPHLAGSASGLAGALIMAVGAVLTILPGLVLSKDNGAWLTLVMMLIAVICGLVAAFYVAFIDRQEARAAKIHG